MEPNDSGTESSGRSTAESDNGRSLETMPKMLPRLNRLYAEDGQIRLWFSSNAEIRYQWDGVNIIEEYYRPDDLSEPTFTDRVPGEERDLANYAVEWIEEYLKSYLYRPAACADDAPVLYETITGQRPPEGG